MPNLKRGIIQNETYKAWGIKKVGCGRDVGPGIIIANGELAWVREGRFSRNGDPSFIESNGQKEWKGNKGSKLMGPL